MKLGELLNITRSVELDDAAAPYLWSDAELIEFASDAEEEACRRASLLVDSTTTAICQIAVVIGTSTYALDSRVIRIRRARLNSASVQLKFKTSREMDEEYAGWETATGTPSTLVTDYQTGSVRLYPTPDATDTLKLTAVRLPLVPLNDMEDTPEINARFHRDLRHWIAKRAFEKRDTDTEDVKRSSAAESRFIAAFGSRPDARIEEFNARNLSSDYFDGAE